MNISTTLQRMQAKTPTPRLRRDSLRDEATITPLPHAPGWYLVSSFSTRGVQYRVDAVRGTCSCPAKDPCKHVEMVWATNLEAAGQDFTPSALCACGRASAHYRAADGTDQCGWCAAKALGYADEAEAWIAAARKAQEARAPRCGHIGCQAPANPDLGLCGLHAFDGAY